MGVLDWVLQWMTGYVKIEDWAECGSSLAMFA